MAKAKEDSGRWSMRQLYCGVDLYVSGYKTRGEAEKAMKARVAEINPDRPPSGLGPHRTMVAQALQDYALERLKFNKGAMQEVNRINRYLRAAGLELLSAKRRCNVAAAAAEVAQGDLNDRDDLDDDYGDYGADDEDDGDASGDDEDDGDASGDDQGKAVYFKVTLVPFTQERAVPAGLGGHRRKLKTATSKSDSLRRRLAASAVAKVTRHQVQGLIDALRQDGREPATIGLERALLRRLFNYARTAWSWPGLADNPATGLTMPKVANERDRVMSAEEELRLDEAMMECRNQLVAPTLKLLTETAMRTSEPLTYATWGDIDWTRNILRLRDSKTLQRDVALSPKALEALRELRKHSSGEPSARLVEITYEALKAAWQRACKRAGVPELHIHDLRHTAATRMARSVVIVKPRAGNMSAQLIRSIFKPRAGRKLLVSIGAVAHGANLATGAGITMKKPFTLADLDDVDRARVADWLERSGKQNAAAKPTVATLEAKLDRLLALAGGSMVASPAQSVAGAAAATVGGDALTKLEQAVDAAGTYITAQLDELAAAGVELSNKSHTRLEPHNANNKLDVLQARANALRFDVLPRFQRTCQASGLMKAAKGARD